MLWGCPHRVLDRVRDPALHRHQRHGRLLQLLLELTLLQLLLSDRRLRRLQLRLQIRHPARTLGPHRRHFRLELRNLGLLGTGGVSAMRLGSATPPGPFAGTTCIPKIFSFNSLSAWDGTEALF